MPTLLDHRGRPVDRRLLAGERAGPSATGARSILAAHPASGLEPERLAALLREAETPGGAAAYLELAEAMEERDLHYLGVLQTRKRQVAQIGVAVEPASDRADDVADADLAREFFAREALEDELFDVLDAVGKGFSATEIVWETSERQWMPLRLEPRLPQWFDFDRESGTRLVRRDDAGESGWAELEPWKFVVHRAGAKSGLPIRGGLARAAAWAWLFKTLAVKDWVRFAEAYGQPLRLGRFGPNASDEDRRVLYRAVANIAGDAAAIVPEGMDIEFVADPAARGRSEIYRDLVAYVDAQLSVAVLGQTLTTQEGSSGSYALGQVHDLVRRDIERADARQLAATLRRDLVVPVVALNRGPRRAYPKVVVERQAATDAALLSQTLERLVPLGLRVRADEVRARLGLAAAGREDEILAPPADRAGTAARAGADRLALARAAAERDAVDLAVAQATDDWQPLMEPLVEPVLAAARAELAAGGDLAAFRDRLPALLDRLDDGAVARLLHQMAFAADLSGRGIPAGGDGRP